MKEVEYELIKLKLKGRREKEATSFLDIRTTNAISPAIHPAFDLPRFTPFYSSQSANPTPHN